LASALVILSLLILSSLAAASASFLAFSSRLEALISLTLALYSSLT